MDGYVKDIRKKIGHDILILTGANVIIRNENNEYLLQKRLNGNWGLLGGLMELGETLEDTAIREVFEESGLKVKSLKQIHTFSGNDFRFILDNQDEIYVVTTLFVATKVCGKICFDNTSETLELSYFTYSDLPKELESEYKKYIQYYEDNFPD